MFIAGMHRALLFARKEIVWRYFFFRIIVDSSWENIYNKWLITWRFSSQVEITFEKNYNYIKKFQPGLKCNTLG